MYLELRIPVVFHEQCIYLHIYHLNPTACKTGKKKSLDSMNVRVCVFRESQQNQSASGFIVYIAMLGEKRRVSIVVISL